MAKKTKQIKTITVDRKLVKLLTEKIEAEKQLLIGESKKEGNLFTTTTKFNSKYISKYEYRQLMGLQDFLLANPKLTDEQIVKILVRKPVGFAFLYQCYREEEDFFNTLKIKGALAVAESIAEKRHNMMNNQ